MNETVHNADVYHPRLEGRYYKLYLAGTIGGMTYDEASDWREEVRRRVHPQIQCYSPLRGKKFLRREGVLHQHAYENHPMSSSRGVMGRDCFDVRTADCLLVNLWAATRVSIGTVMEMAWAYLLGIPVVLVIEPGNLHEHCMLDQVPTYRVGDLEAGINLVEHLLLPLG